MLANHALNNWLLNSFFTFKVIGSNNSSCQDRSIHLKTFSDLNHFTPLHSTPHHLTPLCTASLYPTLFHSSSHSFFPPHTISLHFTPLHSTPHHFTPLHTASLQITPSHSTLHRFTPPHTTLSHSTLHRFFNLTVPHCNSHRFTKEYLVTLNHFASPHINLILHYSILCHLTPLYITSLYLTSTLFSPHDLSHHFSSLHFNIVTLVTSRQFILPMQFNPPFRILLHHTLFHLPKS